MLVPHTTSLLEKGFYNFIEENKVTDLRRMYSLFDRVTQSETIRVYWIDYVKKRGKTILRFDNSSSTDLLGQKNENSNEYDMIEELLKLFDDMENIWKNCFCRYVHTLSYALNTTPTPMYSTTFAPLRHSSIHVLIHTHVLIYTLTHTLTYSLTYAYSLTHSCLLTHSRPHPRPHPT